LQALYDEAAVAGDDAAATVLFDLVKAFESVPLEKVWARGLELGFPAGILRLALEVCSFTRHLTLEGVVAQGVDTLSAILAGLSFATDLLFVVFVGPCDRLMEAWPRLNLSLVVDDLAAQLVGRPNALAGEINAVARQVVSELTAVGCLVSKGDCWAPEGKTVATGTSPAVMLRARVSFKAQGVAVRRHARHLGVDYTPGRKGPRRLVVAAKRLKGAGVRKDRLVKLGLPGRAKNRIMRTAVLPSAVHGAAVTGVTDTTLRRLSSMAHSAFGKTSGRSAYARLYLSGGVPGGREAVAPIFDWAKAVFDRKVPEDVLESAWRAAITEVGRAPNPQTEVRGPAGATVAAALRLGWAMVSPFVFQEPTGNLLDTRAEAPGTLRKAALEGYDDWAADHSSLVGQVGGRPFLEPLKQVMTARRTDSGVRASLRVMAEGGWPSQASLFKAGLADDPNCLLCKKEAGTLYHRLRKCQGTADIRQCKLASQAGMTGMGSAAEEEANPLFRRGIAVAPHRSPPPRWWEDFVLGPGEPEPEEFVFTGVAGSDGSLIDTRPVRARRAGWSAVATNEEGELRFALFGVCPDRCPSAHRADIWGILMVLRSARFPLVLYTDHKSAVDAYGRGRAYCCDSSRASAEIWRDIWGLLDTLGAQRTSI